MINGLWDCFVIYFIGVNEVIREVLGLKGFYDEDFKILCVFDVYFYFIFEFVIFFFLFVCII